jgi:hypothetical protein
MLLGRSKPTEDAHCSRKSKRKQQPFCVSLDLKVVTTQTRELPSDTAQFALFARPVEW